MGALVFPFCPCTTNAKAAFLVNGKATLQAVHAWAWNSSSYAEALVLSADGRTLVIASQQPGFQKVQDS